MSIQARPLGRKGFTLVELLIVVAIIGVLSTVGVPTFRRMIQKSKKSEAKVNLGGFYTAQNAFLSEYGAYGNNVAKMGFEVDGDVTQLTYVVGFMNANCHPEVSAAGGAITPVPGVSGAGVIGTAIQSAFPAYYTAAGATSAVGRLDLFISAVSPPPYNVHTAGAQQRYCFGNGVVAAATVDPGAAGTPNTFRAVAAGVIAPGVDKTLPGLNTDPDIWTIDHGRLLVNNQDGIK